MDRRSFIASTVAMLATPVVTTIAQGFTGSDEEIGALVAWWRGAPQKHRLDTLKLLPRQVDDKGRYHGDATIRSSSSWWWHGGAEPTVVDGSSRGTFVYDPATQGLVITFGEGTIRYRLEGEALIDVGTGDAAWLR